MTVVLTRHHLRQSPPQGARFGSSSKLLSANPVVVQFLVPTGKSKMLNFHRSEEKGKLYRITTNEDAAELFSNAEFDFYDFPVDVGRYYLMNFLPGKCDTALASADYDYLHTKILSLRDFTYTAADDCKDEVLEGSAHRFLT